ncbi:G-ACD-00350 [African swine fever virus]|uniref:ASFV_Ch_ACD_00350 n=1 Tax=African swine fever virus TaxID=10497 RepID=A0A7S5QFQ2_ASF|nr:ASFV_Ch_ACD_00350 [African swine fever virus]UVH34800.1 G-ACD-00350 [African swine fever virus]UVH35164.1 G-ACD-00350 [African swine fever virus]UVH35346.1 G-ACD-00350 [African swine fever virus]UVH35711.1 G-ACD-00350 [African swine fever virus]
MFDSLLPTITGGGGVFNSFSIVMVC